MINKKKQIDLTDKINALESIAKLVNKQFRLYRDVRQDINHCESNIKFTSLDCDKTISQLSVSDTLGNTFAEKYSMVPSSELGKYITKLYSKFKDVADNRKEQYGGNISRMIMTIVFAGMLYGAFEYFDDLEKQNELSKAEQVALSVLRRDVAIVRKSILPTLKCFESGKMTDKEKIFNYYWGKFHDRYLVPFDFWTDADARKAKEKQIELLCDNFESNKDKILANTWALESILSRRIGNGNFLHILMGAFWVEPIVRANRYYVVSRYSYGRKDIYEHINMLKQIDEKYTIAPSTHLYRDMVLYYQGKEIKKLKKQLSKYNNDMANIESKIADYYDTLNPNEKMLNLINVKKK